jgi:hypothetical protein
LHVNLFVFVVVDIVVIANDVVNAGNVGDF